MHYMFKLLCIRYNDHHFASLYSPLFKYDGDIAKTGDISSLRYRFFGLIFYHSLQVIFMKVALHDTYEE